MTEAKLDRTVFRTSRLLDFASEKELTAQVGHDRNDWPLVVLKEVIDNALDAAEEAGTPPEVKVTVDETAIIVADNGPGTPAETIDGVLDFSVRVSSREAYVSPTRGAQGNALKTILAMPFVLDGQTGRVDIAANGQRHRITFGVDQIREQPTVGREVAPDHSVRNGTSVRVYWPDSACSLLTDAKARFLPFAFDYAHLNPHLTLTVDWFGKARQIKATDPNWRKWLPSDPTDPHWYGQEDFARLLCAYLGHDQDCGGDRPVRDLVREFRGLTATAKAKAVLEAAGLAPRTSLSALANGDGLDREAVTKLLTAMKEHSKPVKPAALGVIGKEHLEERFRELGCEMDTFQYKKVAQVGSDGLPVVIETAFAWRGDKKPEPRRIITGVNWSPGIVNPFRSLGTSYGDGLAAALEKRYAGADEPIVFLLHAACPRVRYTDRGKSAVVVE